MLRRQALWVPVLEHNPAFLDGFHRFLHNNPVTARSATAMSMKPEDIHVALVPDSRDPTKQVAAMMAFPVQVSAEACDCVHNHTQHGKPVLHRELAFGFATTVCDSYNSFHIMERLLPQHNPHVSVNIQMQSIRALREGERAVVVSSVDKLGKRLVYCKTEFFVEPPEGAEDAAAVAARQQRESSMTSFAELRAALGYYEKVVSGAHVKSILSADKGR